MLDIYLEVSHLGIYHHYSPPLWGIKLYSIGEIIILSTGLDSTFDYPPFEQLGPDCTNVILCTKRLIIYH